MFNMIVDSFKCFADKVYMDYEHNKPEILVYGGTIGLVVSGVLACVATVKAQKELKKAKEKLDDIACMEKEEAVTPEEGKKARAVVARNSVGRIVLGYLPALALTLASGKCIYDGVTESRNRINALSLALAAETARADKLIERAKKHFGEDAEDKLLHDIHEEEVEEKDDDGNTVKRKKIVQGEDLSKGYEVVLNRWNCPTWFLNWNHQYNLNQLKLFEAQLNEELMRKTNVFGGSVLTAAEVMRMLEYKPAESREWQYEHRNDGYVSTTKSPAMICLGLEEAERLIDFGVCDKEEIILHINFMHDIWDR